MIITKAKKFAEKAHQGQLRKISGTPYFTHLENVALTLFNAGFSNNVVAAGYLHDIIEDTKVTKLQILNLFGNEVVELVLANSENKSLEWEERKNETIEKAKTASLEIKALIAADKLDNTSDLLKQHRLHGDDIWSYFNRGFDKQAWYYQNLLEAVYYGLDNSEVPSYFIDVKRNIEELFGGF
ncbi:HD domain-containing protein [Metabacillus sp. FJAT-53654]|uniref:HD domain-containing protein n=1 Tax=Metabacillus rhizosphaerae TaxID=3117747 RepID=A0ABZ2MQT2_9BACI